MSGPRRGAAVTRRTAFAAAAASLTAVLAACGSDDGPDGGRQGRTVGPAAGTTGAGTVGLAVIGILTADIDRSLGFYRRLGLDVPLSVGAASYHRLQLAGGRVLFWENPAAVRAFDPSWSLPAPAARRIALEFGFDTRGTLDATFRTLTAAGAPGYKTPFELGGGVRYALVMDPDGNQVSLRYPAS